MMANFPKGFVRRMPAQKPGKSEQIVGTDPLFVEAVRQRFGTLDIDLAATEKNALAPEFLTEEDDALSYNWGGSDFKNKTMWLNPPFSNIGKWAEKCSKTKLRGCAIILMLTPASVGAQWFADLVMHKAAVLALTGRLTFVGHTQPYPKDCMLTIYGYAPSFGTWDWRKK